MKTCFKAVKLLNSKYPFYIISEIILALINLAVTMIAIYALQDILTMYEEGKEFVDIVIYLLIRFGIAFIVSFIGVFFTQYENRVGTLFITTASRDFYNKTYEIDYEYFDNPDFLNTFTRSLSEGVDNIFMLATSVLSMIGIIVNSVFILSYIALISWYVILIDLGVAFIYLLMQIRIGYINKKKNKERSQPSRFSWYARRTFSIRDGMADIKTSDIDKVLISKTEREMDKVIHITTKYSLKASAWSFIGNILLALLYPITVGAIVYFTTDLSNQLPVFATLTLAAATLSSLISRFTSNLGNIESVLQDAKVPFEMLETKGKIEGVSKGKIDGQFESIEINNLDFSYTGESKQLSDINLNINKGEHIAIVGANGAGKTTLVRMLLRLYDPNNGSILINGKDYRDIDPKVIRNVVGAVFQNVETYACTIAENVLLRKIKTQEDIDLVNEALKFSGLYETVYSLPDNINTELSREFNKGHVLSQGQNQRLAIARGYAQNFELFILDEPSSALDPLAEAQVYNNMLELGKNKTIVFISHRLTTTTKVDKIYLFEDGKITEEGTHDELMQNNKLYRKMFVSQSHKYLGEEYEK